MPATRIILLLTILGGLVLFALQNWSPLLPLVILGLRTQALPLAFWIVGAIVAGALTTLVVAGLFNLQVATSPVARRSRQTKRVNQSATPDTAAWNYGWSGAQPEPSPAASSYANPASSTTVNATWQESSPPQQEEWEDWSGYQEPRRQPVDDLPNLETPAQDAEDQDWADWEGYDQEEEPRDRTVADSRPVPPPQTSYEVPQEPTKRSQSGTVYSYSYRRSEDTSAGKAESVYDADYRVLRPPYKPLDDSQPQPPYQPLNDPPPQPRRPEPPEPPAANNADEDDWDFDDWDDRPRRNDDDW
jgi:uncharacterized integral membrane protein